MKYGGGIVFDLDREQTTADDPRSAWDYRDERMAGLGDAGVPGGGSDLLYTGEDGSSPLSAQYYRDRITEFQVAINRADETYRSLQSLASVSSLDPMTRAEVLNLMQEFEAKRAWIKNAAQTLNAGAAAANALGLRMPVLSVPPTLGLVPIPLALVGALAVAASVVLWVKEWATRTTQLAIQAQQFAQAESLAQTPEERAALRDTLAKASAASQPSVSANLATGAKWLALGVGALILYRVWRDR